jgi:C1A family cysteine protease
MGSYFSSPNTYAFGYKRDKVDERDLFHKKYNQTEDKLIDLRNQSPPIYDQGHLGSCTANAVAFAYHFDEIKQKEKKSFMPSRLFIYYNERNMEGNVGTDSGAEIRDGIKTINRRGVCKETTWPYDIKKFKVEPPPYAYEEALEHHSVLYKRVQQDINQIKGILKSGLPIVFGFLVNESFMRIGGDGMMPEPEGKIVGGHAVAIVGYDDTKKLIIVRNSWGEEWGDHGYFYAPYSFILNTDICSDLWTVETVYDKIG